MSTLYDRICSLGRVTPNQTIIGKDYNAAKVQPTVRIQIFAPGMVTYEDTQPIIAPDGGLYYATGRGTWGQLYAAGRR